MTTEPRDWQTEADRLANATEDPTAWFEKLYAAGASGEVSMPWDRDQPHWALQEWTHGRAAAEGARGLVVGCGLGGDAEHLAALGFTTTAFDISETAVATAKARHPESTVDYHIADLFDLPADWRQAFDLVVEIFTVQALPRDLREKATSAVRELVAPRGQLLAIEAILADADDGSGPPWPFTRDDIESFAVDGLSLVSVDEVAQPDSFPLWRAELRRT